MIRQLFLIVFLFSVCINISDVAQTFEKSSTSLHGIVYYELQSENFQMCFRRLNATHQVGCSSQRAGSLGIVFHLRNHEDVKWLILHSLQQSVIVVMSAKMFQSNVSDILIGSSKIAGIVIIVENEKDRPDSFSPDLICPNDHYGLYWSDEQYSNCRKTVWNPYGNGMMFMDIPFPLVTISNSSDVEFILHNCFEKFNSKRDDSDVSKCAMEIRDVMDGAKDTPTCMRRNHLSSVLSNQFYCDPLGNFNVYAYLNYVSKTEHLDSKSVIIIAARLDSFSLFDDRYPGYESSVLGFVTLHAVAEALGKIHQYVVLDASQIRPVMFALFHGEAFDYIGSSRMVYDIKQQKLLPLTLESIGTFIEVSQIELTNSADSIWIHTDPVSISKSQDIQNRVKSLVSVMTNIGMDVGLSIKRPAQGSPLPPASLHQFLKSHKTSIAGILLSSHEKEFSNRYYNSMFDDNANFTGPEAYDDITPTVHHIQKIATTVARTVYSLLFGNTSDIQNIHASNMTVANLLYCFARNPDCELFNSTIEFDKANTLILLRSLYLSRYVGVAMSGPSYVVSQHQFLLAHFLGTVVDSITTAEACYGKKNGQDGYSYIFMNGRLNEKDGSRKPVCVRSTASVSLALSPAFSISGYNWSSELYSSWTESYWDKEAMSVRVFLQPSQRQEIVTLCTGLVSFVISLLLVYLIRRKSSILFKVAEKSAQL